MKAAWVALGAMACTVGGANSPTGLPYLPRAAQHPPEFVRQVLINNHVRHRYAAQFGVPEPFILAAAGRVSEACLRPGVYTVWLMKQDGLRYPTVQERRDPTPVFVLPIPGQGPCTLESGTGNPVSPFRPIVELEYRDEIPEPQIHDEIPLPIERLDPVATDQTPEN